MQPETAAEPEEQISVGFEADRLGGPPDALDVRWWFYVFVPGEKLRNQQARKGVQDYGFAFARGGRCRGAKEAQAHIAEAQREAESEIEYWRGQPSHALGPSGELIPLNQLPELPG